MISKEERQKFHLPEDVTTDVLSRLPVKSLLRFKCVCRAWRSIISSPYFASLHLNHSISNPLSQSILVHLSKSRKSIPFDPVTFSPRKNYLNVSLDQACCFGDDEMNFVGSINGLLCICELLGRWVCLWNPSTRMFRKIGTGIAEFGICESIGFGFDPIVNDYKVVVFYSWPVEVRMGLKVWSAKLESWRDIKVDSKFNPRNRVCDVIVNEFAYWIADDHELVSFNMSTEILRLVPMPCRYPEYQYYYHGFIWKGNFALAAFDECQQQYQAWTIENDPRGKEYWRKTFSIGIGKSRVPSFCYCDPINFQNGKLIHRESTRNLILYDIETRKMKKAKKTKYSYAVYGSHYYVESLIWIKGFKPIVENNANKIKKRKRLFLYD